jgi:hypothetical protein
MSTIRFGAVLFVLALASLASAQELSVKESPGVLAFYSGDKLITKFQYEGYTKPIFFPVQSPAGARLTRNWPIVKDTPNEATDHPHQKSAWFVHGDIVAEGIESKSPPKGVKGFDFWSENAGAGKVVCTGVKITKREPKHIVVVTKNEWRSAEGTKILDETRTIHVRQLDGAWLIVVDSDLFASVATLVYEDTKEGSFGLRINESIKGKNGGKIQNAEGKIGEKECWGYPSDWCDYSGNIDGKVAGVAILCDPKNPYPSCFHVRDYGLMAANPFGRGKSGFPAMKGRSDLVRQEKGQHLHFRYGYLLHDGDAAAGRVARHFSEFVTLRESK